MSPLTCLLLQNSLEAECLLLAESSRWWYRVASVRFTPKAASHGQLKNIAYLYEVALF